MQSPGSSPSGNPWPRWVLFLYFNHGDILPSIGAKYSKQAVLALELEPVGWLEEEGESQKSVQKKSKPLVGTQYIGLEEKKGEQSANFNPMILDDLL